MGCCQAIKSNNSSAILLQKSLRAIDINDIQSLNYLSPFLTTNLNDPILQLNSIQLNFLGYALLKGSTTSFIFLHKDLKASIKSMEDLLNNSELTSLHIICAKGYIDILSYYLSFYLIEITEYPEFQEISPMKVSLTLFFDSIVFKDDFPKYLAVHIATLNENISILSFIHNYFKDKSFVPKNLDMEFQEEVTGENCVHIACRKGKYKLLVFFYKICRLNFRVKNKSGLNVINVLIDGSKGKNDRNYFICLRYLVEKVGIDVEYMHQYSLAQAEDKDIVEYLELKLKEIGIVASKNKLQIKNSMPSGDIREEDDLSEHFRNRFFSFLESENESLDLK